MNKQSKWVVGILAILVIALGGYIIYDKLFNKEPSHVSKPETQPQTQPDKKEPQTLAITDPQVETLYKQISYGRDYMNSNYYFLENKELTSKTVSDTQKYFFAFPLLATEDIEMTGKNQNDADTYRISLASYKTAIQKLFGTETNAVQAEEHNFYVAESNSPLNEHCINFQYNPNTTYYEGSTGGCGGTISMIPDVETKLLDASQQGNQIVIREAFVFLKSKSNGSYAEYPKDYQICPTANCENPIGTFHIANREDASNFTFSYDQYQDQMNIITYTFEKNADDSYHYAKSSTLY